jgi:putative transposase
MKKPRYTDQQIAQALRQAEQRLPVDLCRKLGVSETTFYHWKKRYAGMGVAELRRVKQLEEENRRLRNVATRSPAISRRRAGLGPFFAARPGASPYPG